ncbi:MAG: tetratricopeptide repeat protein [Spirochaetes bacterium]|nr:tetratricopeptide repeat protein [Spirochaetota bacterium]
MYYRYTSRQRKKITTKWVINAVLIACIIYVVHHYHQYIFFWKYTLNKLQAKIEAASNQPDTTIRQKQLKDLCSAVTKYAESNPMSSDAFYLLGETYYHYAYSLLNKPIYTLYDDTVLQNISADIRQHFLLAIKAINKGIALGGRSSISDNTRVSYAASLYCSGYYPVNEIYTIVQKVSNVQKLSLQNIRMYSLIAIKSGHFEEGIELVKVKGVSDNIEGRMFLAASYLYANQQSNAIIEYRNILQSSRDNTIVKAVHIELGKIFYRKGVYSQSLEHLNAALQIDDHDVQCKLWLGKVYSAVGNISQAKALWSEVLLIDSDNTEAKRLLGIM